MIYWVAISLWILFLHVFLQGSGGALHIHADKIDPQEEDGNTSCYASTFYSVHSSDILFCWLFEYSIIPTNWTISLQLISRWLHQEALKQCKPCKCQPTLCKRTYSREATPMFQSFYQSCKKSGIWNVWRGKKPHQKAWERPYTNNAKNLKNSQ